MEHGEKGEATWLRWTLWTKVRDSIVETVIALRQSCRVLGKAKDRVLLVGKCGEAHEANKASLGMSM